MAEGRTYAELCQLIEDARLRMAHARTLELRLHWGRQMVRLHKERAELRDRSETGGAVSRDGHAST